MSSSIPVILSEGQEQLWHDGKQGLGLRTDMYTRDVTGLSFVSVSRPLTRSCR